MDFSEFTNKETFDLSKISQLARDISLSKGFDEALRPAGSCLMGISSEIGEAYSALRKDKRTDKEVLKYLSDVPLKEEGETDLDYYSKVESWKKTFELNVKDTFEDELADTVIRLLNFCCSLKVDLSEHIRLKMTYNTLRTWRKEVDNVPPQKTENSSE